MIHEGAACVFAGKTVNHDSPLPTSFFFLYCITMEIDAFMCSFRFASIGRYFIEIAFLCVAFTGLVFGNSPPLLNLALAYVCFSLVSDMIYKNRMRMFYALLSTPELPTVISRSGDVVNTDNLFHPIYAGVLLFFAISKLILACVFASQNTLDGFPRSIVFVTGIGMAAAIINVCAIVSEMAMLVIIGRRHEHELVSLITGLRLVESKDSPRSYCAWKFVFAPAPTSKAAAAGA